MSLQEVFDEQLGIDDNFLPDGWDGESDIITGNNELNEDAFYSDGGSGDPTQTAESDKMLEESDLEALTMGEDNGNNDQNGDADDAESSDGEKQQTDTSRILKLKVNHEEQEIDINKMSDEDLIALLQKGRAFDSIKDEEKKKLYRDTYQSQIDAGMTEEAAQMIAEKKAGKAYSLEDNEDIEEKSEETPPITKTDVRDFRAEVDQLKALYPEVKQIPDEVAKAMTKGIPLLTAYLAYREKQSAKAAATTKKENQILKQNAASAKRAPVKGASGGGATGQRTDNFLAGWDSDPW